MKRSLVTEAIGFTGFTYWTWECASENGIGYGSTPTKAYDEWVSDVPKNWASWLWRKALKKIGWR